MYDCVVHKYKLVVSLAERIKNKKMKPIEQNKFSSTIYGVKLYIDDIETILSKITLSNQSFKISDDDNIYEDLEELKKYKGDNPNIIKIESKSNFDYMFIRIVENVCSIISYGETYNKIAYEIEKIFLKRKNNKFVTFFFNSRNARNNIIILSLVYFGYYLYKTYYLKQIVDIKQSIWTIIIWLLILLITLINPNFNGKIELKRRHENSFFKNNKDKLLVAIITFLVTAFIAYLVSIM